MLSGWQNHTSVFMVQISLWISIYFCETFCLSAESKLPQPSSDAVKTLKLDSFYSQYIDCGGLAILSSAKTSPYALKEASWIVEQMLHGREDLLREIVRHKIRVAVMSYQEFTTDVPEHSDLVPKDGWNRRARGLGATEQRPAVSCAEENLLEFKGDPYRGENIFVHEFAHVIHEFGMKYLDETFDRRLDQAYKKAIQDGLWTGTYAASNRREYWAEGVQSWFDTNQARNQYHNGINTREKLKAYDVGLATLLEEVFKSNEWRYCLPHDRKNCAHLNGYDFNASQTFKWPEPIESHTDSTAVKGKE